MTDTERILALTDLNCRITVTLNQTEQALAEVTAERDALRAKVAELEADPA